jgi:DNA-binding MarR family transcriptional regulator
MSSEIEARTPYVGALMLAGWQWVRARVFDGVHNAGYDDLNPAHVGLFRYPTLDQLRPSEIAERMQITKQSVHDLLTHLEDRGYIDRRPDPSSGRSRIVRLTAKGRRLEREVRFQAHQAEGEIAAILGARQFAQLRHALQVLIPQLAAEPQSSQRASTSPS